jgi:asparagine synthase (glutamine-hydrolysing)
MSEWIAAAPTKRSFEVQRPSFFYLGSEPEDEGGRPMASDENGSVLMFSGFIASDQLPAANGAGGGSDIAASLLRLYRQSGPGGLVGLNGRYVIAVWDAGKRRLALMNDLLGLKPAFFWSDEGGFAFSSSVWPIACHPRFRKKLSPEGVADMLLFNHQQGDGTLFQGVTLLPPGSITTVQCGEVKSERVSPVPHTTERWHWGIERTADAMHELIGQGLARRVPDGVSLQLPLSGGMDSRVMLGFLRRRRVHVRTITQHQPGLYGLDRRYAKRLARRARVPNRPVPIPDDFLARHRLLSVLIGGGLYDIHVSRYLALIDHLDPSELVVSGYMGGELTGQLHTSDRDFAGPEEQFALVLAEANKHRFPPAGARELLDGSAEGLVEERVNGYRQFFFSQDGEFSHRYNNWNLLQFQRRYTSFQPFYFEQFGPVRTPYYDRDYVEFVCSLPFAALEGQRAYREMQSRHFPELAKIPDTNTGEPPRLSTGYVLRDVLYSQYARFVRRPLQRLCPLRRWVESQMQQYGFALMGDSRPVLDHLMRSRDLLASHMSAEAVEAAVGRQRAGDHSEVMGLLGLSAVATALEIMDDPHGALRSFGEAAHPGESGIQFANALDGRR